jgi:radical SAM superfamily enzyme YgiQ (UPF0313 family)
MKVCLISAPTANDFEDREIAESEAVRLIAEHAPLGILSLAAVLAREGLQSDVVDLNRLYYDFLREPGYQPGVSDFAAFVGTYFSTRSYDVFGLSTICSSYPLTLRVARELKRHYPDSAIVLGGPQASVVDEATMRTYPFVDLIVRGEAEVTLPAVLSAIESGQDAGAIEGITYRKGDSIVRNANASPILDLDTLPFPAYHLYPHISSCTYVPLELGRGCPFACTFCSTNDFFRRRFRLKSPAHIIDEMRAIRDAYGITSFDLVHDMFTVDRKRVAAFCEALIESGEKFFWGCSARTDCIDEELIALMARAGCRGIFFGFETGSARMQKIIEKDLDLAQAARQVRICNRYKIKTAVSLITGFPEETPDDVRDTVHVFMDSLRYDHADPQLCILAPLAATPIHDKHRKDLIFDDIISDMSFQGWRQDKRDAEMIEGHPDIFPNFYSVPTPHLDRQFLKELREFILNGMTTLRWLLVALHQDAGNLYDVFSDWRDWQRKEKGPFPENNATIYYAKAAFHRHFIEFVKQDYIPRSRAPIALAALVEYEGTFIGDEDAPSSLVSPCEESQTRECQKEELISPDSLPRLIPGVRITTLGADYQSIVRNLRRKWRFDRITDQRVTVVTRAAADKRTDIIQLSPMSAELLRLCDGATPVREIARQFTARDLHVAGVPSETACLVGVELLRRQNLLELATSAAS